MKLKTAPIKLKSEGYFSLAVYKEDGTEVTEKRVSDTGNVVTYSGAYNLFFEDGSYNLFSNMKSQVGTGTTELTRASTGLTNLLATTASLSGSSRSGNEVSNNDGTATLTSVRTNAFSLGGVVGTISEIGLITNSGSNFIAGQLIKDEFGDPTTLTIFSDEQLVVTYTLVLTYPNGSGSISQGAPVVGSGTVSTPTGSSSYTMYAQPFFQDYEGTANTLRAEGAVRSYSFDNSSGDSILGIGSTTSASLSHDGSGTVSLNFYSVTAAPNDFSSSDIAFILAGRADDRTTVTGVNTTTKLAVSVNGGVFPVVVEFTPALVKTNSDSMTVHMTMDFVI